MNRRGFVAGTVGLLSGVLAGMIYWRKSYPYTVVEIKCWMQIDEKQGYELVPMIRLNNSNWFYVVGNDNPLKLDNRYGYTIEAPKEYQGGEFVCWQSEKTGMIIPASVLRLSRGFESDTWWQNYAVAKPYKQC
jgi:hypothetical protein